MDSDCSGWSLPSPRTEGARRAESIGRLHAKGYTIRKNVRRTFSFSSSLAPCEPGPTYVSCHMSVGLKPPEYRPSSTTVPSTGLKVRIWLQHAYDEMAVREGERDEDARYLTVFRRICTAQVGCKGVPQERMRGCLTAKRRKRLYQPPFLSADWGRQCQLVFSLYDSSFGLGGRHRVGIDRACRPLPSPRAQTGQLKCRRKVRRWCKVRKW